MGPGTLRKTATHILQAEEWWYRNWTAGMSDFDQSGGAIPLPDIASRFDSVRAARNVFVDELTLDSSATPITVLAGGPPSTFRVIESMIQMCSHGTHHRAQMVNMLRRLGATPPEIDYVVWMRATT